MSFYKSSVQIKTDKSRDDGPNLIIHDDIQVSDPSKTLFNNFFRSIESTSLSNKDESVSFIEKHFNDMKKNNIFNANLKGFSFQRESITDIEEVFSNLSSSSAAGVSGIHPKILKLIPNVLV